MTYLGWVLDEAISGEPIASKVINKINGKLKFLYSKNRFINQELRRMLCNALIQPYFDFACTACYPNISEKAKKEMQIMHNKCIRFWLTLDQMHRISEEGSRSINWLPTSNRVNQCINNFTFDFVNEASPFYLKETFEFVVELSPWNSLPELTKKRIS